MASDLKYTRRLPWILHPLCIRPNPNKERGKRARKRGDVWALLVGGSGQERIFAVDFARATINAFAETFPRPAVAGCYFHLAQSHYREATEHGPPPKYMANEESRLRAMQLSALSFLRLEGATKTYGHLENAFAEAAHGNLCYFESTYIGRRVTEGGMNPLPNQAIWNLESRTALCPMRKITPFRPSVTPSQAGLRWKAARRCIGSFNRYRSIGTYHSEQRARRVSPQPLQGRERQFRDGPVGGGSEEAGGSARLSNIAA